MKRYVAITREGKLPRYVTLTINPDFIVDRFVQDGAMSKENFGKVVDVSIVEMGRKKDKLIRLVIRVEEHK